MASRNLRAYLVDEASILLFFELLANHTPKFMAVPSASILPGNPPLTILAVHYLWDHKAFAFTCEHESFPEVPNGEVIPRQWIGDFDLEYVRLHQEPDSPDTPVCSPIPSV